MYSGQIIFFDFSLAILAFLNLNTKAKIIKNPIGIIVHNNKIIDRFSLLIKNIVYLQVPLIPYYTIFLLIYKVNRYFIFSYVYFIVKLDKFWYNLFC